LASSLPPRPSLEWLRKTAKDRLAQLQATNPAARLADAQLAVAREHGFDSWRQLKAHVDRIRKSVPAGDVEPLTADFLQDVGTGRIDEVRRALAVTPALVNVVGPHPFWGGQPQPLHVAIETTRQPMVTLLLEHGADVNGSNDQYDHWSPLMLAIDRKQTALVDELRRRGARIGILEALMLADDTRLDEQLRKQGLPAITPNGGSILAFARTTLAIDRLLDLGAPTDVRDRWGSTPIDAMRRLGRSGNHLVEHMVARGVAASPKEYARLGDLPTLARLVESDPSIARLDGVMMGAVDFEHHALVRWLLERGANPNARSDAGSRHTALHSAAWNGDLPMVRLLLEAGADPTARDQEYDGTPLDWALTSIEVSNNQKCQAVVAYLRAREPTPLPGT